MADSNRVAYFECNVKVLADILHIPKGIRIIGVEQSFDERFKGVFRVWVEGDQLREVPDGDPVPRMLMVVYRGEDGNAVRGELL